MRKYETFFIIDPDLPDEVTAAVDEKIKSVVGANGGDVVSYVPWGKKKLAYPVKKRSRGLYVLMEYAGDSRLVAELERNMRLDERVLKFITVKLDDRYDPEKEAARMAANLPSFPEDEDTEEKGSAPLAREEEGIGEEAQTDEAEDKE
ncbi:30S ribosomal protein S6 [Syntrophobacter fumaroxidans]|uniref:Small ribosomal subunit protein bS6 n=1 Tax=Syntrophobacter fumaroxidans (strain DSM 10017 / MPOB) TaxID=335543 RepID=RS6_SYNFM|nr:30S ribosomal protein S6 [Syntrophobacter fumaroxidans]A0LN59.1 RecName: Full=Small ribosomal subunit protein bS6; AltName: Full=30S ribosomal protein S6 [Syntrophobacter fumaroxidans MPOB]ABK18861.1 SSU ribosomal protein S6P [Syntrophobacter fumaroxidans MPOB]